MYRRETRMLHVYTYSTAPEKVQFLEQSAKLHNLSITNLSKTETWTGFQDRIDSIQEILKTLPDSDIFCFVDAYDIIVNANETEIVETFKSIQKSLLFGAEMTMYPFSLNKETYPKSPTPFQFLNAGCFIGYVKAVKELYSWASEQYKGKKITSGEEDQGLYQEYFLNHQDKLYLDYESKFVLNMNQVPWQALQIEQGKVKFTPFQRNPCFIHFNGMSYLDVEKDFVDMGNNKRGFSYDKVYSRTFLALIGAKFVSERSPLRLYLTSNGHTYQPLTM